MVAAACTLALCDLAQRFGVSGRDDDTISRCASDDHRRPGRPHAVLTDPSGGFAQWKGKAIATGADCRQSAFLGSPFSRDFTLPPPPNADGRYF